MSDAMIFATVFSIVLTGVVTAVFALLLERVKNAMAHDFGTRIELLRSELTSSAEMRRLVAAKRLETAIAIHEAALPFLSTTKGEISLTHPEGPQRSLAALVAVCDLIHERAFVFDEATEHAMLACATSIYNASAKAANAAAEGTAVPRGEAMGEAESAFRELRKLIRRELLVRESSSTKLSTEVK